MNIAGIFLEDRTVVLSTGGDQRLHSLRGVLFLHFCYFSRVLFGGKDKFRIFANGKVDCNNRNLIWINKNSVIILWFSIRKMNC